MRELRDISANHQGPVDLGYLQRKIAAAGAMKTAIKRFLDCAPIAASDTKADRLLQKRTKELRRAMEDYLNVR